MSGINNPTSGPIAGLVNPMEALKPAVTRRVLPGWMNTDNTTRSTTIGQMIYAPILVPVTTSYDRMTLEVISGTPGTIRVGIYNFGLGVPTSLLFDAGTIDTALAGVKDLTLAPAEIIDPGYYFITMVADTAVVLRAIGPEGSLSWAPPIAGLTTIPDMMFKFCVLAVPGEVAQVAGGLVDPAVAPTTVEKVDFIHVYMRES